MKRVIVNIWNNKKSWELEMLNLPLFIRIKFALALLLNKKIKLKSSTDEELIYTNTKLDSNTG